MMSIEPTYSATTEAPAPTGAGSARRRNRWLVAGGIAVLAVITVLVAGLMPGEQTAGEPGASDNGNPTSLATVTRGSLFTQLTASGTLEYTAPQGSAYTVVNQAAGTYSELPSPGWVISRGQVLYRVSNHPVVLLYGSTPVYRSLSEGDTGPDVRELNRNLVALGYASSAELDASSDYFSAETATALAQLQDRFGDDATGSLAKGQAVFLPGKVRIVAVPAILGTNAARGVPIAQATSTSREVVADLDSSEQTEVKVGDNVQITLPAGQATTGVVSSLGTVAGSGSAGPTLPVYISLEHPQVAGTLDQAPVQIEITTASVERVLIVPIDALLARAGGEYAVEVVDVRGVHRLVPVTLGTFDDAAGTVEVNGHLRAGERIVVPSL
jgi:peptidoglycan hydrolase-like protein with peptidoglycan-binding domain